MLMINDTTVTEYVTYIYKYYNTDKSTLKCAHYKWPNKITVEDQTEVLLL